MSICGCDIEDNLAEGLKDIMFGLDLKKIPRPRFNSLEKKGGDNKGNNDNGDDGDDDGAGRSEMAFEQDDEDQAKLEAMSKRSPRRPKPGLNPFGDDNYDKDNDKANECPDDDDNKDDLQNVDQQLADLEIPDFNLSVDFDEVEAAESAGSDDHLANTNRLEREEVFSRRYHPSKEESQELQDLASKLGATSSMGSYTSTSARNLYDLLNGNHSIILMRGPIGWKDRDCELILFTDGFALAYLDYNSYNPLESRYETCHIWNDIDHVAMAKVGRLTISLKDSDDIDLVAASNGPNLRTWFEAVEQVLVSSVASDPNSSVPKDDLGWQYQLVHKPGYTAAVLGDMRLMGNPSNPSKDLNTLDTYHQSTPLHYALQRHPCDANVVEALLRFGADPNKPDGEGRTATYFSQRDHLDDITSILKEFGANESKLADMEQRGALFAAAEHAQRRTEQRRDKERAIKDQKAAEAATKAQSAQSQLSKNMALMIERGEKIEHMDDTARQLNAEAKNFGDMAKQLKEQQKNKKWYQL